MLADSDIIELVADKLQQYRPQYVVLDPVMVATSGDLLLQQSAISSLKEQLLPLANLITPNLPEASSLTGLGMPDNSEQIQKLMLALQELDTSAVLLKGGHFESESNSDDLLITQREVQTFSAERFQTQNTHGTGCTLSSAIASYLAQGYDLSSSVQYAKQYITNAIGHADLLNIGQGRGPVDHFYMLHD